MHIEQSILSDENGYFKVPWNFKTGVITISGGKDIVTGEDYKGEFKIDGVFFEKYRAVTPLTHVANHIWMNTPTELPEEAMDLVLNSLPGFTRRAIILAIAVSFWRFPNPSDDKTTSNLICFATS